MRMEKWEFDAYLQQLEVPATEAGYIEAHRIRDTGPSRRATSGTSPNVQYASELMEHSVELESHGVEYYAARQYEHLERDVLEYWTQPPPITIEYLSEKNRRVVTAYTPDFCVMRRDRIGYEEWKTEEDLIKLSEERPNRYKRNPDGTWCSPPCEAAAAKFGFYYRIRTSKEINHYFQTAVELLEDYWDPRCSKVNKATRNYIVSLVKENQGTSLARLENLASDVAPEDILKLIAHGEIYVDIMSYALDQEGHVPVFTDKETADFFRIALSTQTQPLGFAEQIEVATGQTFRWDGREWTVMNAGDRYISVRPTDISPEEIAARGVSSLNMSYQEFYAHIEAGTIQSLTPDSSECTLEILEKLMAAGPKGLARALKRYEAILPILEGRVTTSSQITSSQYLWLSEYREGERLYGLGFAALLDDHNQSGWHRETYSDDITQFAVDFIAKEYENNKQPSKQSCLNRYKLACEQQSITRVGDKKFRKLIRARSGSKQTRKRAGSRAAVQEEPEYLYLDYRTPVHGVYPLNKVHMDSTLLDEELVHSITGKNMGRAWLTIATDAFTRRVLAVYLTYDKPSYRTIMIMIRLIVKRYGRAPRTVICDRGSEFENVYFKALAAFLHIDIVTRKKPRQGSVIEALFEVTDEEFIHQLRGNTKIMKRVREVTKVVDPSNLAVWFLEVMFVALEMWFYEIYDELEHTALGESPRVAFERTLISRGKREEKHVLFNEQFLVWTLPDVERKTREVIMGRGVKNCNIYYKSSELMAPELIGKHVDMKFDPFNIGIAYVYIHNRWVKCFSQYYGQLQGHTERELQIATEELKRRNRLGTIRRSINARTIALFLNDANEQEILLAQRLRDLESAPIRAATETPGLWMPYTLAARAAEQAEMTRSHLSEDPLGDDLLAEDEFGDTEDDDLGGIQVMDWRN